MSNTNNINTFSEIIRFLRFPLTVMVVMIHANILGEVSIGGVSYVYDYAGYPLYSNVAYFFSMIVFRIAVPMFFLFSGYLFFRDPHFTVRDYGRKLKRRTFSLLVPYVFWNLGVIVMFWVFQTVMPGMTSGANKFVADYQFKDWVSAFWNINQEMPICSQFWFVRDLMVVVICSPLVYFLISKLHYYYVSILGILWLFEINSGIAGLSFISFFFFSLGGLISIRRIDVIDALGRNRKALYFLCAFFVLLRMVTYNLENIGILAAQPKAIALAVDNVSLLFLVATAICITARGIGNRRWKTRDILYDSNFFIYAFHSLPLAFLIKVFVKYLNPTNDILLIFIYFIAPLITIAAGIALFVALHRLLPRFTALITGGRFLLKS